MTPTECAALARYTRAHFPQQPIDEFTADALHELLVDYPPADCRQAVLNIADRGEEWCPPTAVRSEVRRIRTKRINAAPPSDPPAGLTDAEELTWFRENRRAIADGRTPPPARELGTRDMSGIRGALPAPPPVKRDDSVDEHARKRAEVEAELRNRPAVEVAAPIEESDESDESDDRMG